MKFLSQAQHFSSNNNPFVETNPSPHGYPRSRLTRPPSSQKCPSSSAADPSSPPPRRSPPRKPRSKWCRTCSTGTFLTLPSRNSPPPPKTPNNDGFPRANHPRLPCAKQTLPVLHGQVHPARVPRAGPQQGRERVPGPLREQVLRGQPQGQREDAGRGRAEGGRGWGWDGGVWDVRGWGIWSLRERVWRC